MESPAIFSKQNPLFVLYSCNAALLIIKVLFVAISVSLNRLFRRVTPNDEDARFLRTKPSNHPAIERIRRAHLNDLENIPAFLFVSFLYILTEPNLLLAQILFWTFTIARFAHTFVYAYVPVPQPARAAAFCVGLLVTVYMCLQVLICFY